MIFIPALIASYLGRWTDVYIILAQAICSVIYHTYKTPIALIADRISLVTLATHTLVLALSTPITRVLYLVGFGHMFTMYVGGWHLKMFCFDPDLRVGNRWHASIHILGIAIYSSSMLFFLA